MYKIVCKLKIIEFWIKNLIPIYQTLNTLHTKKELKRLN